MKRKSLIFLITLALIGCGTSNNGEIKVEDPYLWLEEVEGKKALEWVESQNKLTEERYSNNPRFNQTYSYLLEDYNSVDRIPYPSIRGSISITSGEIKITSEAYGGEQVLIRISLRTQSGKQY